MWSIPARSLNWVSRMGTPINSTTSWDYLRPTLKSVKDLPGKKVGHSIPPSRQFSHRIHGTGIFTYMHGWFFMVNVGKYTIHGSYHIILLADQSVSLVAQSQWANVKTLVHLTVTGCFAIIWLHGSWCIPPRWKRAVHDRVRRSP